MIDLFFIITGLVVIIKSANILVDNSSALAKKFNISEIIIGLTIVSFGTSAPELVVNILASLSGNTELAIANILGSNIANTLFILGVSGIIYPLVVKKETVWKEIPLSLLAAVLVFFMANDTLIDGTPLSELSRIDGLILLSFFIAFTYYIVSSIQNNKQNIPKDITNNTKDKKILTLVRFIMTGLLGLIIGGKLVVDGSVSLAIAWGISQTLIGLTMVAIGTSLPELFTSAVAAYKGNTDIAIGNAVGSNIFNIFWILGISATIKPLPFNSSNNVDILMVIASSALLFLFMFIGKKHVLERWQGAILLMVYFAYIYTVMIRG